MGFASSFNVYVHVDFLRLFEEGARLISTPPGAFIQRTRASLRRVLRIELTLTIPAVRGGLGKFYHVSCSVYLGFERFAYFYACP